jgi:FkbM family methyltransferase
MLQRIAARIAASPMLRRVALPLFERCNPGDVRIRHHYTQQHFKLHSYRHKGYWFHGPRREQETMQLFARVLRPGDTVVEVGGHIGYLSLWFAELVGRHGHVVVFEPGQNNLPYLRENVAAAGNVEIVEAAVSDENGVATFYVEGLTGQNNSLLGDYARFAENRQRAFSNASYQEQQVQTLRLDDFVRSRGLHVDLIKIDIEGAEFLALSGAKELLAERQPMLLVEVTQRQDEVLDLLTGLGYQLFAPSGESLADAKDSDGNVCAVHPDRHRERLKTWDGVATARQAS